MDLETKPLPNLKGVAMKKISYSKDVDALLIELDHEAIAV